jgi:signal transduction histidine kinase
MIEDLLLISRLEESALQLHPEPIPLSELLREVFGEYGRRAAAKQVELLGPRRTDTHVTADRALLQRVLENILDNSLRYTPAHGRVGVAMAMRVDAAVEIAVSNTGPPIPPADRERIFEKFARGHESGESRGNAGLGLYFCKRAVEALGGHIEVTETPEWPTSFVMRLPGLS